MYGVTIIYWIGRGDNDNRSGCVVQVEGNYNSLKVDMETGSLSTRHVNSN